MHCRECGYALWNLTEPRCPECGASFDLRTYRFVPESVAFACPDCGNLHAGAGESYLPATSDAATCQACGRPMRVTHMRVVPLIPDPPDAIAFDMPWDERAELGFWRAWWRTTRLSMLHPADLVRQSRPGSSWTSSYLYAVTTYVAGLSVNAILLGLAMGIMWLIDTSAHGAGGILAAAAIAALVVFGVVAYAALVPLISFVFLAAPAHLFLWLFASERRGDLAATARVVNYAQGPMALMAIPLCGFYLGNVVGIWMLVSAVLMVRTAHEVSGLKASAAVLWLPVTFIALYIVAFIGAISYGLMQP